MSAANLLFRTADLDLQVGHSQYGFANAFALLGRASQYSDFSCDGACSIWPYAGAFYGSSPAESGLNHSAVAPRSLGIIGPVEPFAASRDDSMRELPCKAGHPKASAQAYAHNGQNYARR